MRPSSIKNRLVISFGLGLFWTLPNLAARYEFKLDFDARYGTHIYGPPNAATNRHGFEYAQKVEVNSNWTGYLGLRADVESTYAANPERYGSGNVGKMDSQTFLLRDNYLQYQKGVFRLRAGYQQVVWGEAFGYYYADIVNPKDYREAGLGSLSRNRLNIPIVNAQWIFSSNSIQILYIPVPGYSLLPSAASDFNLNKAQGPLVNIPITVDREPRIPLTRGEYGVRYTQQYSPFDFSLFYLNYYDRLPVYQYQLTPSMTSLIAQPDFRPLQTHGLTVTLDYESYIFRSEIIKHTQREYNISDSIPMGTVSTSRTNETTSVFGIDLPMMDKWLLSIQYSESLLEAKNAWVSRPRLETIANARASKTFANDITFEMLLTDFTQDSSTLLQSQVAIPLSSQSEIVFGVDRFSGGEDSALGRLKSASRGWILFKATIKR